MRKPRRSILRSVQACGAATLVVGALLVTSTPASAQECNANLLQINISASQLVAVPGEIVLFTVTIQNLSEQQVLPPPAPRPSGV
jgi:hypothetical protein